MLLLTAEQATVLLWTLLLQSLPPSCVLHVIRFHNPEPRKVRLRLLRRAWDGLCCSAALRIGPLRFDQYPTFAEGLRRVKENRLCDVTDCYRTNEPVSVVSHHQDPFKREFLMCDKCYETLMCYGGLDSALPGRTIGPVRIDGGGDQTVTCVPRDIPPTHRWFEHYTEFDPAEMADADDDRRYYVHGAHPRKYCGGNVWR